MVSAMLEFSQTVSKLNKEKKYSNTLEVFKEKKAEFSDSEIANNEYLISTIVTALRHTKNCDHAFKFLEHYKIEISETTNERILNAYGWLLYSKYNEENLPHINQHNEGDAVEEDLPDLGETSTPNNSETLLRIEKFMPLIIEIDNEFSYSVMAKLFEVVMKVESKRARTNWQFISDFCDMVPFERLTKECRTFDLEKDFNNEKRTVELASDLERWYAYKTKALLKLGKFQDCCDLSKSALSAIEKFHYSNEIWFARRIALSKKKLGNTKEAIKELQAILRKKKEWFIQKELAELYNEEGNRDEAFKLAIEGMNSTGILEYKVDLMILLGELLKAKGLDDLAFKHYSLAKLIRVKGEWQIPAKLSTALEQFDKKEIPLDKLDATTAELKKYWLAPKK